MINFCFRFDLVLLIDSLKTVFIFDLFDFSNLLDGRFCAFDEVDEESAENGDQVAGEWDSDQSIDDTKRPPAARSWITIPVT